MERACLAFWLSLTVSTVSVLAQPPIAPDAAIAPAKIAPAGVELQRVDFRGEQFSEEIKLALKPVGRLITALRLRMQKETPLAKAEPLLRETAKMMQAHLVYAAVLNKYGQIQIASADEHPDYGPKVIYRGSELNASIALKMLRHAGTETWMVHRPKHPGHYEMLIAPDIEGIYKDHLIYYCVNLNAICRRAERAMKVEHNEAYYLLSRKGYLIHSSMGADGLDLNRMTKFEKEYVQKIQNQVLAKDFGLTSYIGFARGNAEVVSHQIGWEKVARSLRDDWILAYEEKLPVPVQKDRQLLGSWVSGGQGDESLRLGILQEGTKIYLRGEGFAGSFRGTGRFAKEKLGISSYFQEEEAGPLELMSFDATYLKDQDLVEVVLHWEQDGRVRSKKIRLSRVTNAKQLTPITVPLEFPPFPDPDAKLVVEPLAE